MVVKYFFTFLTPSVGLLSQYFVGFGYMVGKILTVPCLEAGVPQASGTLQVSQIRVYGYNYGSGSQAYSGWLFDFLLCISVA